MSNNFIKDAINKMKEQQKELKGVGVQLTDEVAELHKKYSGTYIGYGQSTFYITNIIQVRGTIQIHGQQWMGSAWAPAIIPLEDNALDFSYYPTKLLNTKRGVYLFDRIPRRQWKWGICDRTFYISPIVFEHDVGTFGLGDKAVTLTKPILDSLFNCEYPTIRRIARNKDLFNLNRGVALNDSTVLWKGKKMYNLFIDKELVADTPDLSIPFTIRDGRDYLKEVIAEL